MQSLPYDVVDVFADAPLSGNQLAVVHGASHLPDDLLLAITREFGYSETSFPEPLGAGDYRVRIFTPGGELPFAGHPTLGTAWVLREHGELAEDDVVQHCGVGEVPVRFLEDGALVELGRPSRILLAVRAGDGRAEEVRVAGRVFGVARGTLDVPA